MAPGKRIAVYVRVSTSDQSTELQIRELSQFIHARGWDSFKVYEDKATGTNGNRPHLKQLLLDARQRKLDIVIIWKLDRLFRSLKDLITTLQEFTELGVDFISLKDNIDLTTSSGRLMMHMLGAFAEFEASLIKERVRAGLRNAKAKGKRLGRPQRRNDSQIIELRAQGKTVRQIAQSLNLSKSTVAFVVSRKPSQNGGGFPA
jgi:DNA invertase Pin-like site-specific DNA recombinase